MILSFTVALAIGLTSIIYIQSVHGSSINFSNGSSSQSADRTVTLIVIKHVNYTLLNEIDSRTINKTSAYTASDFIIHMNGNNPSQFDSPGSETGTNISIGLGPYAVTETKPTFSAMVPIIFTANYSKDCNGTINTGETKTCIINNTLHILE